MTALPPHAPALIRQQAEMKELRWVASQMVALHDRRASETPGVSRCECPLCRHARPWVEEEGRG